MHASWRRYGTQSQVVLIFLMAFNGFYSFFLASPFLFFTFYLHSTHKHPSVCSALVLVHWCRRSIISTAIHRRLLLLFSHKIINNFCVWNCFNFESNKVAVASYCIYCLAGKYCVFCRACIRLKFTILLQHYVCVAAEHEQWATEQLNSDHQLSATAWHEMLEKITQICSILRIANAAKRTSGHHHCLMAMNNLHWKYCRYKGIYQSGILGKVKRSPKRGIAA